MHLRSIAPVWHNPLTRPIVELCQRAYIRRHFQSCRRRVKAILSPYRQGGILMSTTFTLPALPYAYDALGPYMSKETLEFHHDKHHQAYVTNGNKLLEGSGLEILALEDIVKEAYGKNPGL